MKVYALHKAQLVRAVHVTREKPLWSHGTPARKWARRERLSGPRHPSLATR